MKKFVLFAFVTLLFGQFTAAQEARVSTVRNTTLFNGFRSNAANYDVVNIDGRTNVIKINGKDCDWAVMHYQLENYKGKWITVHFSADVMITGTAENLICHSNNQPENPAVTHLLNPVQGAWNRMNGSLTVMPTDNFPIIAINTWKDFKNTIFYFDNINISIDVWDYTQVSALTTVGETSGNARNIYVSTSRGTDNGNGTQARPFAKIAHAMNYARAGDTVLVDSGTYYERIRMPSGSAGRPVTLTAMPNAEVIITPTVAITPQWRQHARNIYVADISQYVSKIDMEFPQLFANRDSMVEARFPNMGPSMSMIHDYKREVAGNGTNKNTVVAGRNIPSDIVGARLVICPGKDQFSWDTASSLIQSVNGRTIKLATDIEHSDGTWGSEDGVQYTPSQGNPFFITGALSLLDAPGEYYFDPKTNLLYFYPPWNGNPDQRVLSMRGKNGTAILAQNTSYVNIKNITVYGGDIFMQNANNNMIENCRVNYAEHFYSNGTNGKVSWLRADRMVVSGSNNRIQRCEFGPTAGNGIILQGDDNIFTNNIVRDTSYAGMMYYGINVKPSKRLEISHNSIINSAHSHINFEYNGSFERCIIRNNYFENHSTLNSDGGAFYTAFSDGGGTEIYNNFVVCGDKNDQGAFKKLRYGLYTDNYTSNYSIHHNIVIGVNLNGGNKGLSMGLWSRGTRFFSNTIIDADIGIGMHAYPVDNADASASSFIDNLLVNCKTDAWYHGTENGRQASFQGNFVNGTIPAPIRAEGRVQSSGNARGTVDAQYRPTGKTPDIGAIPRNGTLFSYGADWNLENR